MPIFTSKSGKQLGGGGEKLSKEKEITGGHILDQHPQILMEESMGMLFYTNMVFLFVGEANISMHHPLTNLQLVVLVHFTHSTERELKIGISIEARMIVREPRINITVWTIFNTIRSGALFPIFNTSSLHLEIHKRDTQEWKHYTRLPRFFKRDRHYWQSKTRSKEVLWNDNQMQISTSNSNEGSHTNLVADQY